MDESNKKWIVFHLRGKRIGSVEYTESNWQKTKDELYFNVIQKDITGTIHLNVIGIRPTSKTKD